MSRRKRLAGMNAGKLLQQGLGSAGGSGISPEDLPQIPGFEVRSQLGRGSAGVVVEAWQEDGDRLVALKLLSPEHLGDVLLRERLEREAKVMARLDHPHIVKVYDFLALEDGGAAMVMELIDGPSLRHVFRDQGTPPMEQAVAWARQIASALQCVHEAELTHRDLKPENLLVDSEGMIRVTDFGIAFSDDGEPRLTLTGMRLGTEGYMPPEQAQGLPVDARCDVYALGVILHEMLVGGIPAGRMDRILESLSDLSAPLREVLVASIQPDAARRLGSMAEFEAALAEVKADDATDSGDQEGQGWQARLKQMARKVLPGNDPPAEG